MIYLDNAATSLDRPECVAEAVTHALNCFGNPSRGAYPQALDALMCVTRARKALADFFGAPDPEKVIFTANATQALNMAILGSFSSGDHVITTVCEHNSVLRPLFFLERERGVKLTILPADEKGRVPAETFRAAIRPETKGIVCAHASNVTGNVTDLAQIGQIAREHSLLLIVDAAQTAGHLPIDMSWGVNILCFTGHKALLGPQGTGGLCLDERTELRPLLRGGSGFSSFLEDQPEEYPAHLEAGTPNVHGIAGLLASVTWLRQQQPDKLREKEKELAESFLQGLRRLRGIRLYGDYEASLRTPVVSLNVGEADSALVSDLLSSRFGIATRPGAHCAPLLHRHFGTQKQGMVRFSFSHRNSFEEVQEALDALRLISTELL